MVVLEVDDFLKGAGIEEIKTVDRELVISTRIKGRLSIEIKDDEEKTGFELEKKCRSLRASHSTENLSTGTQILGSDTGRTKFIK